MAWSRKTGKSLCRAIVWDDSRTRNLVTFFEQKLKNYGIETAPGHSKHGSAGIQLLKELTGLPISTYFSALKLRWMLEHHESVRVAHESDDLMFGTVESWIVYVSVGSASDQRRIAHMSNRT